MLLNAPPTPPRRCARWLPLVGEPNGEPEVLLTGDEAEGARFRMLIRCSTSRFENGAGDTAPCCLSSLMAESMRRRSFIPRFAYAKANTSGPSDSTSSCENEAWLVEVLLCAVRSCVSHALHTSSGAAPSSFDPQVWSSAGGRMEASCEPSATSGNSLRMFASIS